MSQDFGIIGQHLTALTVEKFHEVQPKNFSFSCAKWPHSKPELHSTKDFHDEQEKDFVFLARELQFNEGDYIDVEIDGETHQRWIVENGAVVIYKLILVPTIGNFQGKLEETY